MQARSRAGTAQRHAVIARSVGERSHGNSRIAAGGRIITGRRRVQPRRAAQRAIGAGADIAGGRTRAVGGGVVEIRLGRLARGGRTAAGSAGAAAERGGAVAGGIGEGAVGDGIGLAGIGVIAGGRGVLPRGTGEPRRPKRRVPGGGAGSGHHIIDARQGRAGIDDTFAGNCDDAGRVGRRGGQQGKGQHRSDAPVDMVRLSDMALPPDRIMIFEMYGWKTAAGTRGPLTLITYQRGRKDGISPLPKIFHDTRLNRRRAPSPPQTSVPGAPSPCHRRRPLPARMAYRPPPAGR